MADSSVDQCLAIIRQLQRTVNGARSPMMDKEGCVVNRDQFRQKLAQLASSLPGAVKLASDYVSNINTIRQQAEQDCSTQMHTAKQQSAQLVSDAQQAASIAVKNAEQQSRDTLARAQQVAEALLQDARAQAAQIVDNAQREAARLLSREDILRRARVQASELCETTQQEMDMVRQQMFDYLDMVVAGLDRHLSETLTSIRQERGQLNDLRYRRPEP